MEKVSVQILNAKSGVTQSGVFCEPIEKGLEVRNALAHFGIIGYQIDSTVFYDGITIYSGKATTVDIYFTIITINDEVQEQT